MNISKKYRNLLLMVLTVFLLFSFIEKKTVDIYMIGDSTMASYKEESAPLTGWGQVMSDYFNKKVSVYIMPPAAGVQKVLSVRDDGRKY